MARRSKSNGWITTLAIGAGITVVAVKFQEQLKEMLKDVPYLGEWLNS